MFRHNILPLQRQAAADVHVFVLDDAGEADHPAIQHRSDLVAIELFGGLDQPRGDLGQRAALPKLWQFLVDGRDDFAAQAEVASGKLEDGDHRLSHRGSSSF